MAAQASISAVQLGLPAVAPQIRSEYGLSIAETGALLAASTVGIVATLLAWGALADRVGERLVIAVGLTGAAGGLALASQTTTGGALGAALVLAGAFGSSANALPAAPSMINAAPSTIPLNLFNARFGIYSVSFKGEGDCLPAQHAILIRALGKCSQTYRLRGELPLLQTTI